MGDNCAGGRRADAGGAGARGPVGRPEGDAVATGHALALARGLVAAGDLVQVLAPPSAQDIFAAAGAGVTAVEIPPGTGPRDVTAITALRRALRGRRAATRSTWCTRSGCGPGSWPDWPARPAYRSWSPGRTTSPSTASGATDRALARIVAGAADVTLCPTGAGRGGRAPRRPAESRWCRWSRRRCPAPAAAAGRGAGGVRPRPGRAGGAGGRPAGHRTTATTCWSRRRPGGGSLRPVADGADRRHRAGATGTWSAQAVLGRAPVQLVGQRDDLADLLGGRDVAVVTGAAEASPLFAQEALAAGVALVAPALPGLAELVGTAGRRWWPGGDVDALDVAVRTLLDDPARRAERARPGAPGRRGWPDEADRGRRRTPRVRGDRLYTVDGVPGASADDAPR